MLTSSMLVQGEYADAFHPPVFAPDKCVAVEGDGYCPQRGELTFKLMIFCAMLIYVAKVVPDNWNSFYSKVADGASDASQLQSLRKKV
jgi:hypothetical protein